MNARYEAVVFDLFGTLVKIFQRDAYRVNLAAMAAALGTDADDFACAWERDTANARITGVFQSVQENIAAICETLGLAPAAAQIEEAAALRLSYYRSALVPRIGAVTVLRRLKNTGLRLGLISDCSCEAPLLWPETPFAELIEAPVFSCLAGYRKPNPRLYARVCELLNVKPSSCLYVGDGDGYELSGARDAGMHSVLLAVPEEDNAGAYRHGREEWPGTVVASLEEAAELAFGGRSK